MKKLTLTQKRKVAIIDNLNFSKIEKKLKSENNWNEERVKNAVLMYKRFLILTLLFPKTALVPTSDIDEVWHMHILDMFKYEQDCKKALGFKLYHVPFYEGDALPTGDLTKTSCVYEEYFKEKYSFGESKAPCSSCTIRRCRGKCRRGFVKKAA